MCCMKMSLQAVKGRMMPSAGLRFLCCDSHDIESATTPIREHVAMTLRTAHACASHCVPHASRQTCISEHVAMTLRTAHACASHRVPHASRQTCIQIMDTYIRLVALRTEELQDTVFVLNCSLFCTGDVGYVCMERLVWIPRNRS